MFKYAKAYKLQLCWGPDSEVAKESLLLILYVELDHKISQNSLNLKQGQIIDIIL